jgi:hypothetical protein
MNIDENDGLKIQMRASKRKWGLIGKEKDAGAATRRKNSIRGTPSPEESRGPQNRRSALPGPCQLLLSNERNNFSSGAALSLFCGGENRFEVKGVLCALFLADAPHFVHNIIITHGRLS